jgi:hypothetical protein
MNESKLIKEYIVSYSRKRRNTNLLLSLTLLISSSGLLIIYLSQIIKYPDLILSLSFIFPCVIILYYIGFGILYALYSKQEKLKIFNNKICTIDLNLLFRPIEYFIFYSEINSISIDNEMIIIKTFDNTKLTIKRNNYFYDFDEIIKRLKATYNLFKKKMALKNKNGYEGYGKLGKK